MAVQLLEKTDHYLLGIWKMDEDEAELLQVLGLTEPLTQTNRVRRQEFLSVRAMALEMGIKPSEIAYFPSGKPYLVNKKLTISISHTKNYVAVLLSNHELAGVDVEQCTDRVRKIRHKFMHSDEEAWLKQITNPISEKGGHQQITKPINETVGLLLHWCAKESLFKAVVEDGVDFVQELRIKEFLPLDVSGRFKGVFLRTGRSFEIDYRIQPDFVLTCSFSEESK